MKLAPVGRPDVEIVTYGSSSVAVTVKVKIVPGSTVFTLGTISEGGDTTITRRYIACDNCPLPAKMVTLNVPGDTCNAERVTVTDTVPPGRRTAASELRDTLIPVGVDMPLRLIVPEKLCSLVTVSIRLREVPGAITTELAPAEIENSPMYT